MNLSALWPLAFLILIPGIIILYMLKQKTTEYQFSSIMLWKEVYKNMEANRPFEKLKRNILMILQIIALLGLIFALTSPFLKSGGKNSGNLVIVLDSSASMNADYSKKLSRFEKAKELALAQIKKAKSGTKITIITCDKDVKVEASNLQDKQGAKAKIKALTCSELAGDTNPATSYIQSMVKQLGAYEAYFITDSDVKTLDLNAKILSVASEGVNASVDSVIYSKTEKESVALVKVTNHSKETFETEVTLYGDNKVISIEEVSIPPKESETVYFENVNTNLKVLKAEISKQDALKNDNTAYAVVNQGTKSKVVLVTKSNIFLEKSIQLVDGVELYKTSDVATLKDNEADLYIFDSIMPKDELDANKLYINPSSTDYFTVNGTSKGTILTTKEGTVTKYLDNFQFGVNEIKKIKCPVNAEEFFSAGDTTGGFYGTWNGKKIGVLPFDLHQTDFPLQAEFPIFMNQLLHELLETGLVPNEIFYTGDSIDFLANASGSNLKVKHPSGRKETIEVRNIAKTFADTKEAGVYQVSQKVGKKTETQQFVVNFPVDSESDIKSKISQQTGASKAFETNLNTLDIKDFILLLAILVIGAEWFVYVKEQ